MNEYYKIVALARLAGVKGTNEEVYQKFLDTYNEATDMDKGKKFPKVEVIKNPRSGSN